MTLRMRGGGIFEKYFEKSLNIERRAYLKRLPNFEDFEVERKAFEIAATHRSVDTALEFFVAWPNLQRGRRDCAGAREGSGRSRRRPARGRAGAITGDWSP
jgi:hypothetical protein